MKLLNQIIKEKQSLKLLTCLLPNSKTIDSLSNLVFAAVLAVSGPYVKLNFPPTFFC